MSRPGAWKAARLSVLAAESADPDRFTRGRRAQRDGAVGALSISEGSVETQVQGSTAEPYTVVLRWAPSYRPGEVPARHEVAPRCSCPDATPWCKHAVAVLLALADHVGADPDLLDDWRGPAEHWVHLPERPALVDPMATTNQRGTARSAPLTPDPVMERFFGTQGEAVTSQHSSPDPLADPLVEALPLLGGGERPAGAGPLEDLVARVLDDVAHVLRSIYGTG